jgi:hypothetical protein
MTTQLVRYEAACRAIAEAKGTDEVRKIRDTAEAMRAYAKQAKNSQLEVDAAEIRIRAERRLGELIRSQKETVGLRGPQHSKGGGSKGSKREPLPEAPPTLAAAGIDKKLSSRAQKLADLPEKKFERQIADWRDRVGKDTERVTTRLIREGSPNKRRAPDREPESPSFEPMPTLSDEAPANAIRKAMRPIQTLIEDWPDEWPLPLLIHELQQLVKFLQRIKERAAS